MEKIFRWQLLADKYFQKNKNVFIKKLNGNIYFCKIILVGETKIRVDIYAPKQRAKTIESIDWLNIETFEEVEENKR